jgi:gas vesicle protein
MRGKIAVGAIVGVAVGVVTGILTAPKSGKETRADIKSKANELKGQAGETSKRMIDGAESATSKATEKIHNVVDGAMNGMKK